MRVLIACEFSGVVRDAFALRGHDAWSCDLLPSEILGQHIQGDVFENLDDGWDMLIGFWPCTFLCLSGVRWLYGGKGRVKDDARWTAMEASARNFRRLLDCGVKRVALENPQPHRHALAILGKYTQAVQPWMFGHGETKRTCLWLRNLPPLSPTCLVDGRFQRVHLASPSKNRWKERSRTLPGFAQAMAEQWGASELNERHLA